MSRQSGNFLLQALLALSLVFAFIPFFAGRLATRETDAQMYATTRQVDVAGTAARIFIRENASNIQYDRTVIGGRDFSDMLEPYGLPLGFVPRTALGQDIVLVIDKSSTQISAYLELSGGDVSGVRLAELARRVGFYAMAHEGGVITVAIALDEGFSDVVRRNENNLDAGAFLTDLDMGGFVFDNVGVLDSRRAEFDTATALNLAITGVEAGRRVKNEIALLSVSRAVFQSRTGEAALSLSRGTLNAASVDARTVANYGDTGNFTANVASLYEFSMTAGRTGFTGPSKWNVHGNVVSDRINFTVERLDVSSYINMASGQDVYVGEDLEYNSRSGIETDAIITSNITMRDQTSDALQNGASGAVILDVRPGGTSLLPDAYVDGVDNGAFEIIADAADDNNKLIDCKSLISRLDGIYNQHSLSQYIICQYAFWQRLEQRIDIKQCIMDGRDDCI